jgi:hypothetical protein
MVFYKETTNIEKFMKTVNGDSNISLRIIDWFVTNYAKKYYTIYEIEKLGAIRFKVYNDYKLKLKAYSKKRFDPFCRWKRIQLPYNDTQNIETTIGQLNFFKWAIEHNIIEYIHEHYSEIESDMNARNTISKKRNYTERSNSSTSSTEDEISNEHNESSYTSELPQIVQGYEQNSFIREATKEGHSTDELARKQNGMIPPLSLVAITEASRKDAINEIKGSGKVLKASSILTPEASVPTTSLEPGKRVPSCFADPDKFGGSDVKTPDMNNKTRKRREELSISACKCIKKETVKILVKFS